MALRLLGREGLVPRGRRRWYSADAETAADAVGAGAGSIARLDGFRGAQVAAAGGVMVVVAYEIKLAMGRSEASPLSEIDGLNHIIPLFSESPIGSQ